MGLDGGRRPRGWRSAVRAALRLRADGRGLRSRSAVRLAESGGVPGRPGKGVEGGPRLPAAPDQPVDAPRQPDDAYALGLQRRADQGLLRGGRQADPRAHGQARAGRRSVAPPQHLRPSHGRRLVGAADAQWLYRDHFHPDGWLSSALYVETPDAALDTEE